MAIDFETADYGADSACAVGLVRVEDGEIVGRVHRLIRPPRSRFHFTYIHGITWEQVRNEPTFGEVWADVEPILEGVQFLAAHNAPFDRAVLNACCLSNEIETPSLPFKCTVQMARRAWALPSHRLPVVCNHLGITLDHHNALSDAEACARIVLAADYEIMTNPRITRRTVRR